MSIQNEASKAETKIVTYLDSHGMVARKAAWAAVVIQIILTVVIAMGSVTSIVAAAGCLATAVVLTWLLVKTRPIAINP